MKHSILIEELTPIAAKGTINGKQWRGRIVGTTINIGPCRWKFDAYKLALSNGEKIAIGQRIAKIEKQPTIPTQHSRKAPMNLTNEEKRESPRIEKRLLGLSKDHRTNRWELTCPQCSKRWIPPTTMLGRKEEECPKCGRSEVVDYNA